MSKYSHMTREELENVTELLTVRLQGAEFMLSEYQTKDKHFRAFDDDMMD